MLGFVSLFIDISSEIIHSLLPVFLIVVLGTDVQVVGLLEGIAEATALVTRVFSGALSDWLGRRKVLAVIGYGLGALSKPLFAVAPNIEVIFTARFIDRIGKGIRGAPRDALVADVTSPQQRGSAYGLRQSLDSVGSFAGPLAAIALMLVTGDAFRIVFWVACLPGILGVLILFLWVPEVKSRHRKPFSLPFSRTNLARMGKRYWLTLLLGGIFTLARFSEAFLLLKSAGVGLATSMIPMVLVVMNVSYSLTAYPAGILSDRIGRKGLMALGVGILICADLLLAATGSLLWMFVGSACWGVHLGLTQGMLSALVADSTPAKLRGTAFGIFGLVTGLSTLLASVSAGWLWQHYGPAGTFLFGASIAGLALVIFLWVSSPWTGQTRKAS